MSLTTSQRRMFRCLGRPATPRQRACNRVLPSVGAVVTISDDWAPWLDAAQCAAQRRPAEVPRVAGTDDDSQQVPRLHRAFEHAAWPRPECVAARAATRDVDPAQPDA